MVADLTELQASQSVKIAGANPSTGVEDNFMEVDTNGNAKVIDYADGVTGSAVPTVSTQVAGSDGTNLRTLKTDTQGRLILAPYTYFHPVYTTRIQTASNISSSNVTSVVVPISATTSGSLIVVTASTVAGTASCTDSASQTYSTAVSINDGSGGPRTNSVFYKANSAAGVTTVTVSSTSSTGINVIVTEYSNVTTSPLDQIDSNSNTGLTWTSTSTPTTTQAQELLIGSAYDISHNNSTLTAGSGWVLTNTASNGAGTGGVILQEEQYVRSTGSYAATGSVSSSDTVLASIATFKTTTLPTNFIFLNQPNTIKGSTGILGQININSAGTTGSTASFYDGSVSASTKIATLDLTQIRTFTFNLEFLTSLILVVNSSSADFTIMYN